MDNRKIFRSYKDKVRESTLPYPSKGSVFSRVKQFFQPTSVWAKRANSAMKSSLEEESNQTKENRTSTFPESDVSILRTPLGSKADENLTRTPNQVLSSFFHERGDKPLSEIEYEGVVSLLSKSKSVVNTPNNSVLFTEKRDSQPEIDTTEINNTSRLLVTPYKQKTLKNTSMKEPLTVFSTPEYRPVYHRINESSNSKNIPSVKRVYQFSGLPSPYRTRIRAPTSITRPKRVAKSPAPHSSPSKEYSQKPLSQSANTLLSILDNSISVDQDLTMESTENTSENDLKRFSNPYNTSQSIKKPRTAAKASKIEATPSKKTVHFTAKDINLTLAFDKSEELSINEKDSMSVDGNLAKDTASTVIGDNINENKNKNKKDENKNKNESDNENKMENPTAFKAANTTSNDSSSIAENYSKQSTPLFSFTKETAKVTKPVPISFNFGITSESIPTSQAKVPSATFSFEKPLSSNSNETVSKISLFDTPTVATNKDKITEIEFPKIIQTSATLDYKKVQQYVSLFEF